MALAIVDFDQAGTRTARFRVDIGSNAFYSYAIGGEETTRQNGLEVLADPSFTSPVYGPVGPASRGRASLEVPLDRFDKDHRRMQLASFRTKDRVGPAISDIVIVPAGTGGLDDLPPPSLSFATGAVMNSRPGYVESVPYSYQKSQTYSSAMFWGALASIIPQVLPALGSLFGGIFKPGADGKPAEPTAGNVLTTLTSPENVKIITDLIKQISSAKAVNGSIVYRDAESHRAAVHALSRYPELSQAQVAPALLAALPALMPMLEKVLNPETVKAILENVSPAKLIGAVTESVGTFAKLGMEKEKQLQEHLERLNPGVKNPELYQLLAGLSAGEVRAGSRLNYRRIDAVKLAFAGTTSQTLYGRSRLAYRYGQDLGFPIDVETPKAIRNAAFEITLKEAGSLRLLHEKRQTVGQVESGALPMTPAIPWHAISKARAGEDYLVTVTLYWNGKKGQPKRGTAITQLITLVDDYAFDRVEDAAPDLIPLSDWTRDRDFWQKVWDQTFDARGLTRVRLSCEYCYVLEGQRTSNARMETKTKISTEKDSTRREGQLKGGMILSPDALNRLLPRLSGNQDRALSEAQLHALRSPDFVDRFNQAAKTQLDFKGRRGETAALWVYPEMKLREVVLKKAGGVNEHGHVQDFEEETVRFPMPAMVHFVGASSAS